MNESDAAQFSCACGRRLAWNATRGEEGRDELTCSCGRKYELEFPEAGRAPKLEPLTPEASQPLARFSRELELREDCQRYHFLHLISGHRLPVHILFSPSAGEAEVAFGAVKPFRITPVGSPVEARRRWIEWFDLRPGRGGHQRRTSHLPGASAFRELPR
jgi:hypothetical protein